MAIFDSQILCPPPTKETFNDDQVKKCLGWIISEMRKGDKFYFVFIEAARKWGKEVAEEAFKFIP